MNLLFALTLFVLLNGINNEITIPIIKRSCSVNRGFIENSDILNNTDFKCLVATFNIGSPKEPFSLLIDTSNVESWVFSIELKKEVTKCYDTKKSITYIDIKNMPPIHHYQYSGSSIKDFFMYEGQKQPKNKFLFGLIKYIDYNHFLLKKHEIKGYNGKLGLFRRYSLLDNEYKIEYSYISHLKLEGLIKNKRFRMTNDYIYIDSPPLSEEYQPDKVYQCNNDNVDIPYWYCFIYSLSLKLKTEEINIDIISEYGFLVSSLPVITAPRDTGNKLFTRIVARNKQCIITPGDNILFLQCEAIPKDLSVCFGLKNNNKALCLNKDKLFIKSYDDYRHKDIFVFLIIINKDNVRLWNFGLPFFQDNIISFDNDKNTIEIVQTIQKEHKLIVIINDIILLIGILLIIEYRIK